MLRIVRRIKHKLRKKIYEVEQPVRLYKGVSAFSFTDEKVLVALQVHVFFIDIYEELVEYMNHISFPFDLYVSTDTEEKKEIILKQSQNLKCISHIFVDVIENRGRDVAPLLRQIMPVIDQYKYIGHIHTKRSLHVNFGEDWRKYCLYNLLGTTEMVNEIMDRFETDEKLGMIFPDTYPPITEFMHWDGSEESVEHLLKQMKIKYKLPEDPIFPASNMFWARVDAVKSLFKLTINWNDFPDEQGQLNATLAHSIERIWTYVARGNGYTYELCLNGTRDFLAPEYKDKRIFYTQENEDLKQYGRIIHSLNDLDTENCEQFIFLDQDFELPLYSIQKAFDEMESKQLDAWSILENPDYFICIQSKPMLEELLSHKDSFLQRYKEIKDMYHTDVYIHESKYIDQWIHQNPVIEKDPFVYLIFGCPFIKKGIQKNERMKHLMQQWEK